MPDVIVVGAGPAGAVAAGLIARAGASVTLLDRMHFPRPKACAEYMSPGVLDVLERTGFASPVRIAEPLMLNGMEIVSPGGRTFRVHYARNGRPAQALTLPRLALDHALVSQAVQDGADLLEGIVVREPILENGRVLGVHASSQGRQLRLRAPITVIADGARSRLRAMLDLDRPVRWPRRLGLVAHYEGPASLPGGYGQMHVGHGGYCGVAPLPGGGVNVGLVLREGNRCLPRRPAEALDGWIAAHPALARALHSCRRTGAIRGMSPVGARGRDCAGPGFLLTGDAAGFFDPFTGEGIYRALVGGEIASGAALRVLATGTSPEVQRDYVHAREDAFRDKERLTRLVQLFVQVPSLMEYALPRLAARPRAGQVLSSSLGDLAAPGAFLRPGPLWEALRP